MNFKKIFFFAIPPTHLITESSSKIDPEIADPCFQLLNGTGDMLKKLVLNSALQEPCTVWLSFRFNPVLFQHLL
jgi:hypothetical protein